MTLQNIVRGISALISLVLSCFGRFAVATVALLTFAPIVLATTATIRVHADNGSASPSGLGDGWGSNHAYLYLQDAIARAGTLLGGGSPPDLVEIWVAGNTTNVYRPDQGSGHTPGTRTDTFAMRNKVMLFGGFPNSGTPVFADRNPATYMTILDGDLDNDGDYSDNSYHVVTANNSSITDTNCRIDGVTVTRGNGESDGGGGLYIIGGSNIRVDRCTVTANHSGDGGYGAGIKIDASNPVVTRSVISFNQNNDGTVLYGGGIVVGNGSGDATHPVRIHDCTILANRGAHGGGVAVKQTSFAQLLNCLIISNSINPTTGNTTPWGGGLGVDRSGQAFVINCTFSANSATKGGAVAEWDSGSYASDLHNSILWGDSAGTGSEIYVDTGSAGMTVDRCNVQNLSGSGVSGSITSTNNLASDPLFVDPDGANNTPGDIDDNYRLQCGSPCINDALDTAIPTDEFNLDDDPDTAERTPDRDLADRIIGGVPDRGCYEVASIGACLADVNGDGTVSVNDLLFVITHWGPCASPPPASCPGDASGPCQGVGDGQVNVNDLLAVITNWGADCGSGSTSGGIPQTYHDCEDLCYGLTGQDWADCMSKCFQVLCEQGHHEYCDP